MNEIQIKKRLNNKMYSSELTRYSPCIGVLDRGKEYACKIIEEDIYHNNIKLFKVVKHIGIDSYYFSNEIYDYKTGIYIEYVVKT